MSLRAEIKSLIAKEDTTLVKVVSAINEKYSKQLSIQNLSNKMTKETLKYSEAKEIADVLGYEIKWVKKDN